MIFDAQDLEARNTRLRATPDPVIRVLARCHGAPRCGIGDAGEADPEAIVPGGFHGEAGEALAEAREAAARP